MLSKMDEAEGFQTIDITKDAEAKAFMRKKGHRTVPQLYWNDTHLNKFPTAELTKEHVEAEINYEDYIGGVENWGIAQRA